MDYFVCQLNITRIFIKIIFYIIMFHVVNKYSTKLREIFSSPSVFPEESSKIFCYYCKVKL